MSTTEEPVTEPNHLPFGLPPGTKHTTYKPGKTARKTARRRAKEAEEKAAAALEAKATANESTLEDGSTPSGVQTLYFPPEKDSLEDVEDGETDNPFDIAFPVTVRVETAASAFIKKGRKRKLNKQQEDLLRAYLRHGGIKLQKPKDPKAEAAKKAEEVDIDDIPAMDPDASKFSDDDFDEEEEDEEEEKEELSQQKVVDSDPESDDEDDDDEDTIRQVDFYGCTASFLSSYILGPDSRFVDLKDIQEAPRVCGSFLRYLLLRKAAPEFEDSIRESEELTKKSEVELPLCKELSFHLPGKLNKACSMRFGGQYHGWLDLDAEDAAEDTEKEEGEKKKERVIEVEGVEIENVSSANFANVEGWGPPPENLPKKKKNQPTECQEWNEQGKTESVFAVTKNEVLSITSRYTGISTSDTSALPKPNRVYSLARIISFTEPSQTESDSELAFNISAAFYPAKLRLVESAEEDVSKSEGRIVEIYFDRIATEKLRIGMIIEAAFYELPQNKWYMDQVALVLPGYTNEDWEF